MQTPEQMMDEDRQFQQQLDEEAAEWDWYYELEARTQQRLQEEKEERDKVIKGMENGKD